MENTLFSSQAGFMTALNGVYIELLSSNLYGGTLSYKTFDILAQYYDCDKDEQTWQKLSTFDQTAKKGQVAGLWSKAYTLLVNVNTIIEACDGRKDVLNIIMSSKGKLWRCGDCCILKFSGCLDRFILLIRKQSVCLIRNLLI